MPKHLRTRVCLARGGSRSCTAHVSGQNGQRSYVYQVCGRRDRYLRLTIIALARGDSSHGKRERGRGTKKKCAHKTPCFGQRISFTISLQLGRSRTEREHVTYPRPNPYDPKFTLTRPDSPTASSEKGVHQYLSRYRRMLTALCPMGTPELHSVIYRFRFQSTH